MDKKRFNNLVAVSFVGGLIYVPTKSCNAYMCVSDGWDWIFNLYSALDPLILLIQLIVIGLILFVVWQTKVEK